MKSNKYWSERAAKRMYDYQKQADSVANDIANAYISSTNFINDEMTAIFRTFTTNGGLDERDARKLLNALPDDTMLSSLKKVVKSIKDPDKRQEMLNIINSPAYAYRIRRFEQLQKDIDVQSTQLAKFEQKVTKQHYIDLAGEAYSRAIFDVQKGTGIGFSFANMSKSRTQEILKQNWSGKHYSERIWGKASEINKTVKKELLVQFMTGRSYRKTASEIEQRMAVGAMEARRLVRTESTYVANSAELESYKECGVNKFEFVATLDMRTSDICAAMDGKTFDIDKSIPGTNIPPLHPWCRSTTIAVIDAAVTDGLKRRAKDPETGKYVEVPADMTYPEWKESLAGEKTVDKTAKITGKPKIVEIPRKEFTNIEDAKRYANSIGIKYAQFDKMPITQINNAINAVETLPKNCRPVFIGDGKDTSIITGRPLGRKSDMWYGVTYDYRPFSLRTMQLGYSTTDNDGGLIVGLNTRKFKTLDVITQEKTAYNKKYFEKFGRTYHFNTSGEATAYHEIGHCYQHIKGLPNGFEEAAKRWAKESNCDMLLKPEEAFSEAWAAYHTKNPQLPDYIASFIEKISAKPVDNGGKNGIIKAKIKDGSISLKINHEKQARHIKGSPEYVKGKSYITISEEEAQRIVDEKHGTGVLHISNKGRQLKEVVDCDKFIGVFVDSDNLSELTTNRATIHYSKSGTHIVPARKE